MLNDAFEAQQFLRCKSSFEQLKKFSKNSKFDITCQTNIDQFNFIQEVNWNILKFEKGEQKAAQNFQVVLPTTVRQTSFP